MSVTRLPQPPHGYQRPTPLPLLTLAAVTKLLPRLRCGTCRARLTVEPPMDRPGRLACLACAREYAEVVDRLPERVSFTDGSDHPKRGRPRSGRLPCDRCKAHERIAGRRLCEGCRDAGASIVRDRS